MSFSSGLFWGYVEKWSNRFASLLIFVLIARQVSPAEMGAVAFARLFIDYFDVMSGQGYGVVVIQNKNINNDQITTAFWNVVIGGCFFSVLIILSATFISNLRPEYHNLQALLSSLSVLIIINSLSRIHVSLLTKQKRFKELALRSIAMTFTGGIVGVYCAFHGYGAWSMVLQAIVGSFFSLIVLWKTVEWRPKFTYQKVFTKNNLHFTNRIILDQNVVFFYKRLDELIIGLFLSPAALGLYGVAKRIYITCEDMLLSVILKVVLVTFSNEKDTLKSVQMIPDFIKKSALLTFPVFLITAVLSQSIIEVLFGKQWTDASNLLTILMFSSVFLILPPIIQPYFTSLGKAEVPLRLNFNRVILTSILLPIGCYYGLFGVAVVLFVRNFLCAWLDIYAIYEISNDVYLKSIKVFFASFLSSIPMLLLSLPSYFLGRAYLTEPYLFIFNGLLLILLILIGYYLFEREFLNRLLNARIR